MSDRTKTGARARAAARPQPTLSRWLVGPITALAAAAALSACAGGGGLGDILGGVLGGPQPSSGSMGNVVAEIRDVNTRSRTLEVRTQQGQQGEILYDDRTQVVYRNQQYPVTALERGDVVEMRVQETSSGYYTDQILVRQSVQERSGNDSGSAQRVRAEGEVREIDTRRGWFDLATRQGVITVTLPYNPPSSTVREFERLRRGDYIGVEGYLVANDRIELERFYD